MKRHLILGTEPINEAALLAQRAVSPAAGAVVTFVGVVRGEEAAQPIRGIEYEAFREMAEHQLELIFQEMETRWPLESVRLVHCIGVVPANQPSVWVEVVAPHRAEAFAACQFLIEHMKRRVPIWKKPLPQPGASGKKPLKS